MSIETLVREEIRDEIEQLGKMEVGTEQYKVTVDGVTKMMDRVIEMEKIDIEHEERVANQEIDTELRVQQMKDEKKDRLIKNILTGVSVIGGMALTVWGSLKSWKFEETGTITSTPGRKFINNLFSKK